MPQKRYTAEQIIPMLRRADVELGQGKKIPEVCKLIGIAERESLQTDATVCDEKDYCDGQNNSPKKLSLADLSDDVRADATADESAPFRTRT